MEKLNRKLYGTAQLNYRRKICKKLKSVKEAIECRNILSIDEPT